MVLRDAGASKKCEAVRRWDRDRSHRVLAARLPSQIALLHSFHSMIYLFFIAAQCFSVFNKCVGEIAKSSNLG